MEWTVQELAERAGISGRTLRHYHQIGLLEPDRVGSNGYRYYGADAVSDCNGSCSCGTRACRWLTSRPC